jgi:hypothetical protein
MTVRLALLDIGDIQLVVAFLDRPATAADYAGLEAAAVSAGFEGEIVAVWPDEHGRTRFLARPERHAFLQAVDHDQLRAQANATLRLS